MNRKLFNILKISGIYLVLIFFALVYLMPFIRSLFGSFMTWEQASYFPPQWIPNPMTFTNYLKLVEISLFPTWIINTAIYSGIIVLVNILTASMSGYAFASLNFPKKDLIFNTLL